MEELEGLVAGVRSRAEAFSDWTQRVESALDGVGSVKIGRQGGWLGWSGCIVV